jgi:peptidoglycan lytic transglycosylase
MLLLPSMQLASAPPVAVDVAIAQAQRRVRAHLRLRVPRTELDVLDGHALTVRGTLSPAQAGRELTLKALGAHGWRTVAHTYTGPRGHFSLRYTPHGLHARRIEVRYAGDSSVLAVRRVLGALSVFRLAGASWYGGGGSLACGGWLTSSTLGVANKTLPCGTLVTLRYRDRSIRVPVVDRGPYVAGRDFDLTEAAKQALGFEGVGEVWSSR